jgi:hypothetical protein
MNKMCTLTQVLTTAMKNSIVAILQWAAAVTPNEAEVEESGMLLIIIMIIIIIIIKEILIIIMTMMMIYRCRVH